MSVYRVTEVIGTSTESWEAAARSAVETAAASVRELRVAEVIRQDVTAKTATSPAIGSVWESRSSTSRS
jgi:flavin-binding protein dodecin